MIDRGPMIGFFLAMTTAVFWGALPIAMKQAVEVMDPFTIVWYRFITAAFGLGLFLAWRKQLPTISNLGRMSCVVLVIASLGLAGNFVLYNSSLKYLSPPVVQVIIQCMDV